MFVYTLTHPELSEPLVLESEGEHSDTFIANNAWHYVLRTFDANIDRRAFTIARTVRSEEDR
jgi:hypothetical protein